MTNANFWWAMSLQNPCVSIDFRKFFWSFLIFIGIYFFFFFFHKMMKFYIVIFSAWISSTSTKPFFSQKYNRNIFHLLKFIFMDFFWLLSFWQEFHWFYISIFKKLQTIYQYCYQRLMLLLERISSGGIISHHLKI